MLTRLEVDGFKNLRSADVRFGPFTCIVGYNASGKSNLFDAITFLSLLTEHTFSEAAEQIRGTDDDRIRHADPRDLFWRGTTAGTPRISLAAEMIVPDEVIDDLGQTAHPTATFLRYEIELGFDEPSSEHRAGRLTLLSENLRYITQGDAASHLAFEHSTKFRRRVVSGRRTGPFISTDGETVQIHQDAGARGRPLPASRRLAMRSLLSTGRTNASPTILAARREMQSWRRVALEPSALRSPDRFSDDAVVGADGRHIPAALHRMRRQSGEPDRLLAGVTARMNDLAGVGLRSIQIDEDSVRELYTLRVTERTGATVPAKSLSEGTLRFLALCTMLEDSSVRGVLCMEEPENGLHPENIPPMVRLLADMAVDAQLEPGPENPFRQVIVNTHSPHVVDQVDRDDVLIARTTTSAGVDVVRFASLIGTWRARTDPKSAVGPGALLPYARPYEGQLAFDFVEAG